MLLSTFYCYFYETSKSPTGSSLEEKVGDFPSENLCGNHPDFHWLRPPTLIPRVSTSFHRVQPLLLQQPFSCHCNHLNLSIYNFVYILFLCQGNKSDNNSYLSKRFILSLGLESGWCSFGIAYLNNRVLFSPFSN